MYLLQTEIWLDTPLSGVFDFFADAANLGEITPSFLDFQVLTPQPIAMGVGTLIDYRLRVRGIPLRWQSEITEWDPPWHFTDEQRRGPYRLWRHHHDFVERDGRTLAQDHVEYDVPGGSLIHALFVRRDVEKIFAHRTRELCRRFGQSEVPIP